MIVLAAPFPTIASCCGGKPVTSSCPPDAAVTLKMPSTKKETVLLPPRAFACLIAARKLQGLAAAGQLVEASGGSLVVVTTIAAARTGTEAPTARHVAKRALAATPASMRRWGTAIGRGSIGPFIEADPGPRRY